VSEQRAENEGKQDMLMHVHKVIQTFRHTYRRVRLFTISG